MPFTALVGTEFGFDFNPGNDLVRVVSDAGQNLRVLPDDGVTTTDVNVNPVGPLPSAAAYSNNFAGTITAAYYTVDAAGDALQVLGRPSGNAINGDVQTVGSLGVGDVSSTAGFDIFGTNNQGLLALNLTGSASSDLYTVNLSSGAASRINTVGGGERVRGLAYARTPVATVFAVTSDNHLVSFKHLTPGTFDTDVMVSGLAAGEAIVAMDVRPSNGALYALTDAGRVYTIDTATGTASGGMTLTANTLDLTAPFTALSGTRFGADFSPLDNLLRVESDTGQNLRVNVDAGTVTTDGALTPGTPQVLASAYSNSYAGAVSTTHYALDLAAGALVRQTSVNGTLVMVGSFNAGTTFALEGAFDIAGGESGLPIAALQPSGASQSTLYRVNLANGALTSMGLLGSSGTTVVRALAVRLQ